MNESTQTAEACDEATVEIIVEGRFSDAGKAIGKANLPTLQKAAQRCAEAFTRALDAGEPCGAYSDRSLLCRQRIRLLTRPAESF